MNEVDYLYLIIAFSSSVSAIILSLYFFIKAPSIIIFSFISLFYTQLIRPIAVLINGGTIISAENYNNNHYIFGLMISSLFVFFSMIGTVVGGSGAIKLRKQNFSKIIVNKKFENFAMAMLLAVSALLVYIGGVDILFINRSTTISIVNPLIRYIYPFVVIFLAITTIHAALILFESRWLVAAIRILIILLISGIIGQRGFVIVFLIISYGLIAYSNGFRIVVKNGILFAFLILISLFMKDIIIYLFSVTISDVGVQKNIIETILSRPDGDSTEVWMLTQGFIHNNDYLYGKSIINNIFNIIPHNFRIALDLKNGQDILNEYYNGDEYILKGFGFNVTLPVELYLNFGIFSLPLMIIIGYFLGKHTTKFYMSVLKFGEDPGISVLKLYAIWTITSSLSGFQWYILFYVSFLISKKVYGGFKHGVHHGLTRRETPRSVS